VGSKNEKIHDLLIEKSRKFPFIKNEIRNNGVLKITKQNIDLFSFMVKTIIAQQISNEVAEMLWERLCSQLEQNSISIKSFKNIRYLKKILIKTKISDTKESIKKEPKKGLFNRKSKPVEENLPVKKKGLFGRKKEDIKQEIKPKKKGWFK